MTTSAVDNVWQHYVPAGYLKRWAAVDNGRKSRVWRHDGATSREVSCETVCAQNFTYSKNTAAEREQLGKVDALLPSLIGEALAGTMSKDFVEDTRPGRSLDEQQLAFNRRRELFALLALLHARSPDFIVENYEDRLRAITPLWVTIQEAILGVSKRKTEDPIEQLRKIVVEFTTWRLTLLTDARGRFWTSENPSLVFTDETRSEPLKHLELWCPISPHACARFARVDATEIGEELREEQVHYLNAAQVVHSTRAIFSAAPLTPRDEELFHKGKAQRGPGIPRRAIEKTRADIMILAGPPWSPEAIAAARQQRSRLSTTRDHVP